MVQRKVSWYILLKIFFEAFPVNLLEQSQKILEKQG